MLMLCQAHASSLFSKTEPYNLTIIPGQCHLSACCLRVSSDFFGAHACSADSSHVSMDVATTLQGGGENAYTE